MLQPDSGDLCFNIDSTHLRGRVRNIQFDEEDGWILTILIRVNYRMPRAVDFRNMRICLRVVVGHGDHAIVARTLEFPPRHAEGAVAERALRALKHLRQFTTRQLPSLHLRSKLAMQNSIDPALGAGIPVHVWGSMKVWIPMASTTQVPRVDCPLRLQTSSYLPAWFRRSDVLTALAFDAAAHAFVGCCDGNIHVALREWYMDLRFYYDRNAHALDAAVRSTDALGIEFLVAFRIGSECGAIWAFPSNEKLLDFCLRPGCTIKFLSATEWLVVGAGEVSVHSISSNASSGASARLWRAAGPPARLGVPTCLPRRDSICSLQPGDVPATELDDRLARGCRMAMDWSAVVIREDQGKTLHVVVPSMVLRSPWEGLRGSFIDDLDIACLRSEAVRAAAIEPHLLLDVAERLGCLSAEAQRSLRSSRLAGLHVLELSGNAFRYRGLLGRNTEEGWLAEPGCQPFPLPISSSRTDACYVDRGGWLVRCRVCGGSPPAFTSVRICNPSRADCYAVPQAGEEGQPRLIVAHRNELAGQRVQLRRADCPLRMSSGGIEVVHACVPFCASFSVHGACNWVRPLPSRPTALAYSEQSSLAFVATHAAIIFVCTKTGRALRIIRESVQNIAVHWSAPRALLFLSRRGQGISTLIEKRGDLEASSGR